MENNVSHDMLMTMMIAISAGIILMVFARRLNLPAIVLLLLGGVVLGPQVLNVVQPDSLGGGLSVLVSLAVGIILFEGGLTLDLSGYRQAPTTIRRLLTVGVLITWGAVATILWMLFDFGADLALLSASLVIVTGPTVIAPLLKRIRVKNNLHNILLWEGVLIDPIGVFIAILCFEWVSGHGGGAVVTNFAMRAVTGVLIGAFAGLAVDFVIRRKVVPDDMHNVFGLASAVLIYGFTEWVGEHLGLAEAGILSVVVAGFVIGHRRPLGLKQIQKFKAEITDVLIGMLFILLAARLEFDQFRSFGLEGLISVVLVIFAVRPASVFLSTIGTRLNWRERAFLGWVAPRGIVAASMASLFAINLSDRAQIGDPTFVETFTYSVIVGTVVLQGLTAGPLARLLGLRREPPAGWMIVGAHQLGRALASFLRDRAGVPVILVDLNHQGISDAREEGLVAIRADARNRTIEDWPELQDVGNLLALTDNEDLNALVCQRWSESFGPASLYRWHSPRKHPHDLEVVGRIVWSRMPKPSLVSLEMARGEAQVFAIDRPASDAGAQVMPLIGLNNGTPILEPDKAANVPREALGAMLCMQRDIGRLGRGLSAQLVFRVKTKDHHEVLAEMVARLVAHVPALSEEMIMTDLLERERVFPCALGNMVAVPHVYCPDLAERVCAVGQAPQGIEMETPDGRPIKLLFLVVSPSHDPEGHLATLAEVASLASNLEQIQALVSESDLLRLFERLRAVGDRDRRIGPSAGVAPERYDDPEPPPGRSLSEA